jgi:hypothetical protein
MVREIPYLATSSGDCLELVCRSTRRPPG